MAQVNWNALLEDILSGKWKDPDTGKRADIDFETIRLEEDLDGREAELVAPLRMGSRIAVVSDTNTYEAMGRRVGKALRAIATVEEVVLEADIACDEPTVDRVRGLVRGAEGVVAVGSGVVSDTCKFATFKDKQAFAVFGTAASMNGYAASTASVSLANGFKLSLPAHAPRGIFLDLKVSAAAPAYLSAAGLGDSLCRPTAQIDWWGSHRLFATFYSQTPYLLQQADEPLMMAHAAGLSSGDVTAVGYLHRVLTLCGLGNCFTKVSHHGSMGEHQVSHWIDMFAGDEHPGTIHGQQVGAASIIIAKLQQQILALDKPPRVRPTRIDEAAMLARYGDEIGRMCIAEYRKKALDEAGATALNDRLAAIWPVLRSELQPMTVPVETMRGALISAGGPVDGESLGLPPRVWRNAIKYAREIRNRWSFLDYADDAGLLDDFLDAEGL
jgi:glycerol-1-phosphate dehydrogenase [NAD(P)+]